MISKQLYLYISAFTFYLLLTILSLNNPFFWDTILYSKLAFWFIEHDFGSLIVPLDLDTGNPHLLSFVLALVWKLTGYSLAAAHWLMLPFLVGIAYYTVRLIQYFIDEKWQFVALLMLLLEPTILAQSTLTSADTIMLCFYLMGVYAIVCRRRYLLIFSVAFLPLLAIRGAVLVVSLFITELALILARREKIKTEYLLYYAVGGIAPLAWYFYHYFETGWLLFTPTKVWSAHRSFIGISGIIHNLLSIARNLNDFGRLFVWLAIIGLAIYAYRSKRITVLLRGSSFYLLLIVVVPLVLNSIFFLPFSNPIGHRYYMVVYLLVGLWFIKMLEILLANNWKKAKLLVAFIVIGLISGHFWVYPVPVANGWDSSLAHVPYFALRQQMIAYLDTNSSKLQISKELTGIGSSFPNNSSFHFANLDGDKRSFSPKNLETDKFIIQSNIFNDFSADEVKQLREKWVLISEFSSFQVYIRLYKKPESKL